MDKSPSDGLQKYRLKRKSPNFSRKKNISNIKKYILFHCLYAKKKNEKRGRREEESKNPDSTHAESGWTVSFWSYFINRHKTRTSVLSFTLKKTNLYILKRD